MKTTEKTFYIPQNTSMKAFCNKHLPEFDALDRYKENWAVFGGLTYARDYPPAPKTQLIDFMNLMKSLGSLNHSHPDLLHWFVRVEKSDSGTWHMHFILGHERVTNGHHTPMTVSDACKFLGDHWTHGISKIERYDESEDGVGYVTKIGDPALVGITLMSRTLQTTLARTPSNSRREKEIEQTARYHAEGRDELCVEILTKLRRRGFLARFADEPLSTFDLTKFRGIARPTSPRRTSQP